MKTRLLIKLAEPLVQMAMIKVYSLMRTTRITLLIEPAIAQIATVTA